MINFNEPFRSEKASKIISDEWNNKKSFVGGGYYTKLCENYLNNKFGYRSTLLTTSCTDALEIAATLLEIKENDHIIVPAYTFVSTVLPFIKYTRNISFADCENESMNVSLNGYLEHVTRKTKIIIVVNYGGANPHIESISNYCKDNNIILIEDAAQSIGASINNKPYGLFGDLATISFHDTKNINSAGEGGALIINNKIYNERANIVAEKGTNRKDFNDKKINKYEWIDFGSSHIISDFNALCLYYNLIETDKVNNNRSNLFRYYQERLNKININYGPKYPENINYNGHLIYILLSNKDKRKSLIKYLLDNSIESASHYMSLESSPFSQKNITKNSLCSNSILAQNTLLRLPIHSNIKLSDIDYIVSKIHEWKIENE